MTQLVKSLKPNKTTGFSEDTAMRRSFQPILSMLVAIVGPLTLGATASADDTEIFMSQPDANVRPNILLIVDTSGSMNKTAESSPLPYDPTHSYSNGSSGCNSDYVYFYTSNNPPSSAPTSCSGNNIGSFPRSALTCIAATAALDSGPGYYSDNFIRWGGSGSSKSWNSKLHDLNNPGHVECKADEGIHGPNSSDAARWPRAGNSSQNGGRYTNTASQTWWTGSNIGVSKTLYSANYIRYNRNPPQETQTRMNVVKAAAASFIQSLPNVNLGVMRYSANSHSYGAADSTAAGGMVMSPVSPINDKRTDLIADITTSNLYEPHGYTPMSETLFEAYRYFDGGRVHFGADSRICTRVDTAPGSDGTCRGSGYMQDYPSVGGSLDGENYRSPFTESCQANYVVFLTDGLPYKDNEADDLIAELEGDGTCNAFGSGPNSQDRNAGRCLGALAQKMRNSDLGIRTYFIGFGSDFDGNLEGAFEYLQEAAMAGGGQAYPANDFSTLSGVFNTIITSILQTSTTFTTPTVAVNAFNRTQTLDELFVSVFKPNSTAHWPGNLKKYRVEQVLAEDENDEPRTIIYDADNREAVDSRTGFFADNTRSYWSATVDGPTVDAGGAASRLPNPENRNLYTYIGPTVPGSTALLSAHELRTSNTDLEDVFVLDQPEDPTLEDLINWARGEDIRNEDGDSATTVRHAMGDPVHSPPAVVIYGGTPDNTDEDDAVVYLLTNDGYLHAFDTVTGDELWAYVPQEYLPNLRDLYLDAPTMPKLYALDGTIRVLKYDVNGDGVVSGDDRVILYFGTGRGGNRYYALDVTNKNAPRYMWSLGPDELPGIGQTWSTPTITRVNIAGATQNSQKLAIIFGGGYDPTQDTAIFNTEDSVGNRVFMVDAVRGSLLWSAGLSGADLNLERMTHSIPGGIAVLDMNGDTYADRMYAGDMAAQLWRFDIVNGNDADSLVTGGVIASLGTKDDASPVEANARRFYSRPDVAALQRIGAPPILNIAIGSGYRGHPLNTGTEDRFYSVRDLQPFGVRTDYSEASIIRDSDLQNVTDDTAAVVPANSPGWRLFLNQPQWQGEKSLSPSNTFDNKIFFTTYIPPGAGSGSENTCSVSSTGHNRAYAIDAFNAAPVTERESDTGTGEGDGGDGGEGGGGGDPEDRYQDLAQGGIAPEVAFLFPEQNEIVCLSGVEVLSVCKNFNSRMKTYWRESNAQ